MQGAPKPGQRWRDEKLGTIVEVVELLGDDDGVGACTVVATGGEACSGGLRRFIETHESA